MTRIRRSDPISRKVVEGLILGTAPEQIEEMKAICQKYDPRFFVAEDGPGATLQANTERVLFDNKTLTVYWLLSFAGWRTLECYSPAVICSLSAERLANLFNLDPQLVAIIFPPGTTIADVLARDSGLLEVETRLSEKIRLARSILHSDENDTSDWPEDIPPLGVTRESLRDDADKATFDLAVMSTAYAFCHELRHIMFAKDGLYTNNTQVNKKEAKGSRPEEELACDIWARDFLTSRIGVYAKRYSVEFDRVLAKRSIAAAIGVFVLYETTERIGDAGDEAYPPLAERLNATLRDTALDSTNNFWVVYACVLVAILRRRNRTPKIAAPDAKQLCERLVEEVRQTS